jgi:uncharacterized protein YoxC
MRFVKGFEYIVVLIAAIIFLFIIIFITIRQVKKLTHKTATSLDSFLL